MKYLTITILSTAISFFSLQSDYKSTIIEWQNNMNSEFANEEESPLTKEGLEVFKGLDFYRISESYNIKASLTLTPYEPVFKMPTTTDRKPEYRKYGIAKFVIDGNEFELSVYQNQQLIHKKGYEDYLFIPFTDLTSGNSSYGGGRYIDVKIPKDKMLIIDFNKAYNPYCAYNHKYSCPIPPSENFVEYRLEAGVKSYNDIGKH